MEGQWDDDASYQNSLIGIVDVSSLDYIFDDNNGKQLCDRRYYFTCMKEEIVLDHLHLPSMRMMIV